MEVYVTVTYYRRSLRITNRKDNDNDSDTDTEKDLQKRVKGGKAVID